MIIQARMGSTRLPGKSMMDLAGKPLLARIYERVKRCRMLSQIVLATTQNTDDDVLVDLSHQHGIEVYRGSEKDLVDRYYGAAREFKADVIVRLPADNPVVEPVEVDRIVTHHLKGEADFSSNIQNINGNGYPDGIGAEVFALNKLEEIWRIAVDPRNREHPHTYFLEHPHIYKVGTVVCPSEFRRPDLALDVNTREQYGFLKGLYEYLYPRNPHFHITDVIEWHDRVWNRKHDLKAGV